jgi:hypothetical protein
MDDPEAMLKFQLQEERQHLENPELVASWKAERRWFRCTVGFTAGMCGGLAGSAGVAIWFNQRMKASLARTGEMSLEGFGDLLALSTVLNLLFLVFGIGFLVSLIKWLLAIRKRRRAQAATGFLPRENR